MEPPSNQYSAHLIATAHQLIDRLSSQDMRAAFLFGSAAWGDADAASDLDIMLLLDRPAGYREVTRVRLADVFGQPLSNGPIFADLDRISFETFTNVVSEGSWHNRVVYSIILYDTDDAYARLRSKVSTAYLRPSARHTRFFTRQRQAEVSRRTALDVLNADPMLAALHARLALQEAGIALIELSGNRFSPSHFVTNLQRALCKFGDDLFNPCLAGLSLDAPYEAVTRSRQAYDMLAYALKGWMSDPDLACHLTQEQLAWARFTYGEQTYEEIEHKVSAFTRVGALPALLFYLDGLLQIPMRIQMGMVFLLRSSGVAGRMPLPDFQTALRQEQLLYNVWVEALRLSSDQARVIETVELVDKLITVGQTVMKTSVSQDE